MNPKRRSCFMHKCMTHQFWRPNPNLNSVRVFIEWWLFSTSIKDCFVTPCKVQTRTSSPCPFFIMTRMMQHGGGWHKLTPVCKSATWLWLWMREKAAWMVGVTRCDSKLPGTSRYGESPRWSAAVAVFCGSNVTRRRHVLVNSSSAFNCFCFLLVEF